MRDTPADAIAYSLEFQKWLGAFQFTWCAFDLTTDFAIGKFLKVTNEEAHLIVSGMTFGKKGKLLRELISRSSHPRKDVVRQAFNEASNSIDRDGIIHSYIESDAKTVSFISKNQSGTYKAKVKTFTLDEFRDAVELFVTKGDAFHRALGATPEEINEFAEAALKE
jgi:hypothetical protein